jgi:hypothetical protein
MCTSQIYYSSRWYLIFIGFSSLSKLIDYYFSHANDPHNKDNVFPVPVGLCSNPFYRLFNDLINDIMNCFWMG